MAGYLQSAPQQVTITIAAGSTTGTATISSVNTANCFILWNGETTSNTSPQNGYARLTFTNSTTITATRDTSSATTTVTLRFTVVELVSGAIAVGAQYGTVTLGSGVGSNTATISTVNTANAACFWLGASASLSSVSTSGYVNQELTNSTTVTATRSGTTGTVITSFCVVEFSSSVVNLVQHQSLTHAANTTAPTQTITSVNTSNTLLLYGGVFSGVSAQTSANHYLTLTNATTVTLTRTGTSNTSHTIKYDVLEFKAGVINSLQAGTTTMTGVTSNTSTITSVNTSNAAVNMRNFATNSSGGVDEFQSTVELTNATTVTVRKNTATSNVTVSWEVIEFVASSGTTYNDTISESVTAAETDAPVLTANAPISQGLTAADSQAAALTANASDSEPLTASDSVSGGLILSGSVTESATAADTTSTALTANPTLTESATGGNALAAAATYNPNQSEACTAVDGHGAAATYGPSVSESLSSGDAYIGSTGSVVYNETITEAVTLQDGYLTPAASQQSLGSYRDDASGYLYPMRRTRERPVTFEEPPPAPAEDNVPVTAAPDQTEPADELARFAAIEALTRQLSATQRAAATRTERQHVATMQAELLRLEREQTAAANRARREEDDIFMMLLAA